MAARRRTVQERILDRQARIEAEQKEIDRLREIEEHAATRSEWVDGLLAQHGVEARPKDRDERARLALLLDALAGQPDGQKDMEQLQQRAARLEKAVLAMAVEVGIETQDRQAMWTQLQQRYALR